MKIIIKIFICFSIVYTPFFAFAGAAENWEIVQKVYDPSKNVVDVTAKKITQQAANSGVYKVQIPVNAATLGSTAKMMLKGGVAVAAITALVNAVGWVIDEGSKVIKKPKDSAIPDDLGGLDMYWIWNGFGTSPTKEQAFQYGSSTVDGACTLISKLYGTTLKNSVLVSPTFASCYWTNGGNQNLYKLNNSFKDPNAPEPEYIVITDTELGNEILGQGTDPNSKPEPVPSIITDAYSPTNPIPDAPAPKETVDALENANPEPETEPEGETTPKPNTDTDADGKPDAYDPAKPSEGESFKLPAFCEWAPSVCDFFSVQKKDNKEIKENQKQDIAQNKTFFDSVKDWFDWSKDDTDLPDDEKPEISQIPTPELKEDAIKWSAQCPSDVQVPINLQGVSSTITFSWSPWCQLLDMIKPAIIASAYIGAAFIVLGLRT